MGTVGGRVPTEKGWMLDNASGWIIQLVKDYEQTGDTEYLKAHLTGLKRAMKFLYSRMPQGSTIPVGPTTYDDFTHPPLYSYYAGVWLTTLKAYEAIGKAIGDESIVKQAQQQFATSQKEALEKLWNGRFFAYGCEPDGSKRLDNVLFTGQLAGQFLSRYCGWGDVYPMDIVKASMISQCKISLSKSPDYYANKVWDINLNRGIDNRGSQCWPFYLESYTALAGMQAGFYEDAMDIMKHIQLVHLRKGWTWTQNLWNPSDITYMTAPVTWFSTDVLAGAGVNIPRKELRLAPVVADDKVISIPLFYPNFWGVVTADPQKKSITFKITKKYGKERISFNKVISEPAGLSTSEKREIEIKEFVVEEGKTYYRTGKKDVITEPKTKQSVRIIEIPGFLKKEIQEFVDRHYGMADTQRLFPVVQEAVQHKMKRQIKVAGVKKIRVHDLRHSHVAYLIEKGVEPLLIKERLGHKDIRITLNTYGHLYPNQQRKVANLLDEENQIDAIK